MIKRFPEIFAHRGFSGAAPENTLSAFQKALKLPIEGIEFDVHLSKDDKAVVIHDETLERTTNGKGWIKDFTYDQLKKLDAGSWFGRKFAGERIPLLEEVLDLVKKSGCLINIELKTSIIRYTGIEKIVNGIVKKIDLEKRVIISSFNHSSVKEFKEINPQISTAVLIEKELYKPADYFRKLGVQMVHSLYEKTGKGFVDYLKGNGFGVRCYTINTMEQMQRVKNLGIDGIFTNYPDLMLKA